MYWAVCLPLSPTHWLLDYCIVPTGIKFNVFPFISQFLFLHLFLHHQGPEHPNPGQPYTCRGFPRFCFLPDNDKGRKVKSNTSHSWINTKHTSDMYRYYMAPLVPTTIVNTAQIKKNKVHTFSYSYNIQVQHLNPTAGTNNQYSSIPLTQDSA